MFLKSLTQPFTKLIHFSIETFNVENIRTKQLSAALSKSNKTDDFHSPFCTIKEVVEPHYRKRGKDFLASGKTVKNSKSELFVLEHLDERALKHSPYLALFFGAEESKVAFSYMHSRSRRADDKKLQNMSTCLAVVRDNFVSIQTS